MCVWYFFPRELSFGRGSTAPVGGGSFPTITPREPWDGKDGEVSRSRGFLPSLCISGKEVPIRQCSYCPAWGISSMLLTWLAFTLEKECSTKITI